MPKKLEQKDEDKGVVTKVSHYGVSHYCAMLSYCLEMSPYVIVDALAELLAVDEIRDIKQELKDCGYAPEKTGKMCQKSGEEKE